MAEFPGNSRVSTDYTTKTTTVACLEAGCGWDQSWQSTNVEERVIAAAFRAHHRQKHQQGEP